MPPPDRAPDTEDPPAARDSVESLVEEFFELRRRGETPDAEAFARRAPGRDVEFLELVAALDVLERAAATVGRTPLEVSGRLGRFRLVRLVGRGGMGSVYEAIDEDVADERARHVALKVLPLHASLDGREVDRFRREAQAVARLVHPHIVPVLGFGEHQGSHWLAMPFVPGRSLDRVLREPGESGDGAPRMSPQEVARHGVAIAEALACAHAQGVLHRDVKPSNVLLDPSGTIWITDFGLAKLAKAEGAASLTRTGETVGTPRYMAPEAFTGWADPRTDVWGVGATLYELLAGQPAFGATSRAELAREIADVEPTPLHRIDLAIPRDLATIVHHCLRKEPAERYATAQQLADDLRRFLSLEPIRARPPTLGQRVAARLAVVARRHRGVVAAAVAALVVLATISWGFVASLHSSNVRLEVANGRAVANLDVANAAIGQLIEEVAADQLSRAPALDPLRRRVLTAALYFEEQLLAQQKDDPEKQLDVAAAHARIGFVDWELGQLDAGRDHLRLAATQLRVLVATQPGNTAPVLLLARALEGEALVARQRGDLAQAEAALRESRQVLSTAIGDEPRDVEEAQHLLSTASLLAEVLASCRRPVEAVAILEPVLERARRKIDPGGTGGSVPPGARKPGSLVALRALRNGHYWLAWIEESTGEYATAAPSLERALDVSRVLTAPEIPDGPDVNDQQLDASYRAQYADLLHKLGRDRDARPIAQQALADLEAIVRRWPMSSGFRLNLSACLADSARIELDCDPSAVVDPLLLRAIEIAQACLAEAPEDAEALAKLVRAETARVILLDEVGDSAAARALATKLVERIEAHLAHPAEWNVPLVAGAATASYNLGIIEAKRHDAAAARAAHARARELADWLLAGEGPQRAARTVRTKAVLEGAAQLFGEENVDAALAAFGEVEVQTRARLGPDLAAAAHDRRNVDDADSLVRALNLDANARFQRADEEGATARLGEAIAVGEAFAAAWPDRVEFTAALGAAHADLSRVALDLRHDPARARSELLIALALIDAAVAKAPREPLWRGRLAWICDHLAGALDNETDLAPIVAAVVAAADRAPNDAAVQVEAARVLSRAVGVQHAKQGALLATLAPADPWADAAMVRLHVAARAGFSNAKRLETDVAFAPLRERGDFATLVAEVSASRH